MLEVSATYQAILVQGIIQEARRFLLIVGEEALGRPSLHIRAAVNVMTDVDKMERLGKRLFHVRTWEELLGTPTTPGRQKMMRASVVEARRLILRLGKKRFGPPEEETEAALNRINDLEKLEELIDRVIEVGNWQELLPAPPRRRGRSS